MILHQFPYQCCAPVCHMHVGAFGSFAVQTPEHACRHWGCSGDDCLAADVFNASQLFTFNGGLYKGALARAVSHFDA